MDLRLTVRTTVALMLALFMTNGHADIKRTAAGHPDLTGTYNVATLTPLQRPKRYGDKLTITPGEAQAIAEYWASNLAKDSTPSDPDREAPPEGGAEIYVPEFSGAAGKVGGTTRFTSISAKAISNLMVNTERRSSPSLPMAVCRVYHPRA